MLTSLSECEHYEVMIHVHFAHHGNLFSFFRHYEHGPRAPFPPQPYSTVGVSRTSTGIEFLSTDYEISLVLCFLVVKVLLQACHSQWVFIFLVPLYCYPLSFLVLATFLRVLFSDRWLIKTLSLLLWSRYKWIQLEFLLKNNYRSVGVIQVLQCRNNYHN